MVVLILALCIPATAFVTGFFVLKGVKVGQGTDEPKTVYKEPKEPQQQEQRDFANTLQEWLNGEQRES